MLPAHRIDQHDGQRRVEELPERAGRSAEPEGKRAPLRRQQLSEGREDDRERRAGEAETDESAGRCVEQRRARRVRHQGEAGGEHQGAGTEHPHGAVAVGDDAGERLADAPQQILQREREGENVAAPVIGVRHRRQKEAQCRARPERHHRDQAAEADDDERCAPRAGDGRRGSTSKVGHVRLFSLLMRARGGIARPQRRPAASIARTARGTADRARSPRGPCRSRSGARP